MSAAADRIVGETRMVCNRRAGIKPRYRKIMVDIIVAIVAPDFDDREHRLTRQGYSVRC